MSSKLLIIIATVFLAGLCTVLRSFLWCENVVFTPLSNNVPGYARYLMDKSSSWIGASTQDPRNFSYHNSNPSKDLFITAELNQAPLDERIGVVFLSARYLETYSKAEHKEIKRLVFDALRRKPDGQWYVVVAFSSSFSVIGVFSMRSEFEDALKL